MLSFNENLNFHSFLLGNSQNMLTVKEEIEFNLYQNSKLVLKTIKINNLNLIFKVSNIME